jgi:hypothetical protein
LTGSAAVSGRYELAIDLPVPPWHIELNYGEFSRAMDARDGILASMRVRHILSDPPGKVETEGKGEGNEPDRDQR